MTRGRKLKGRIVLSLVAVLIACVGGAIYFYPIQAIFWHTTHGNHLKFGNLQMKLPLLWWPTQQGKTGEIEVSRGEAAQRVLWESLNIRPLKPEEVRSPEQFLATWNELSARISKRNEILGRSPDQTFRPVELQATNIRLYCLKEGADYIACRSPQLAWNISVAGPTITEEEAESVLSSLERTH
jgi:hypothetical protein